MDISYRKQGNCLTGTTAEGFYNIIIDFCARSAWDDKKIVALTGIYYGTRSPVWLSNSTVVER